MVKTCLEKNFIPLLARKISSGGKNEHHQKKIPDRIGKIYINECIQAYKPVCWQ